MPPPRTTDCPACRRAIDGTRVYCMVCGAACHRECFEEKGICPIESCTGMRFRETPRGKGVNLVATRNPDGKVVPRQYCVDYTSTRETWVLTCGVVLLMLGLLIGFTGDRKGRSSSDSVRLGWILGGAGAVLLGFRWGISDYRVLDGRERVVWNYRTTFGHTNRVREASFDQCRGLALVGRRATRRVGSKYNRRTVNGTEWNLSLFRNHGGPIQLADSEFVQEGESPRDQPPSGKQMIGRNVAKILGLELEFHPPR